ncbi:DUF3800 domain-containing protein [Thermus brockianus]|uniref:DUF3800 domain-containing protein n=1 Tax=Thermus brockianus TaxID=56956 RepID=A0ABM7XMU0_THEBO|nr:DUF3800 domain-containing protein [Thermus brockianus]BDG17683.1 hypothetical protein TbrSNM41_24170 [Thermus brockianus]
MSWLSLWVDESEKGDMLVVSGVLTTWESVCNIVRDWRRLKENFGLPPEAEIKWNLPQGHETRRLLEETGKTTRDLCEKLTDFIAERDDLTCVTAVMLEKRNLLSWKRIFPKASVRDFYCEGLKYLIQRAAEEVVEDKLQGCVVVCDTPGLGRNLFTSGTIRRGPGAVEKAYLNWYHSGAGVGPGRQHHKGPLATIGFHPSVLTGDATYHDMLQIADVIAGVTREWVNAVRDNRSSSWELDRFQRVRDRFRNRHGNPGFFGDGFVLWPWHNELWVSLQQSVR